MQLKLPAKNSISLIAASVLLCLVSVYPQSTKLTRGFGCLLVVILAITISIDLAKTTKGLIATGILWLAIALMILGPGRSFDVDRLKEAYIAQLRQYLGTEYVWGGENRLGIDCSGLVRSALVNAALLEGVRSVNPRLIRYGLGLWWYDRTARQLGEGYNRDTFSVASSPSIRSLPEGILQKGDLAVTADGVHVLAFCGNGEWIEADPSVHKVISTFRTDNANPWLGVPVRQVRWWIFAAPGK